MSERPCEKVVREYERQLLAREGRVDSLDADRPREIRVRA